MMYGHVDDRRPLGGAPARAAPRIQDADRRLHRVRAAAVRAPERADLPGRAWPGPGRRVRDNRAVHAMARLMLHGRIDNIQTSWVKLGADGTRLMLAGGANDLGGTLMEETICRMAGSQHGSAKTVSRAGGDRRRRSAARSRQRTTTYGAPPARPAHRRAPGRFRRSSLSVITSSDRYDLWRLGPVDPLDVGVDTPVIPPMSFGMPEMTASNAPRPRLVAVPDQGRADEGRGGHAMSVARGLNDAPQVGADALGSEVTGSEVIGAELTAVLGPALGAAVSRLRRSWPSLQTRRRPTQLAGARPVRADRPGGLLPGEGRLDPGGQEGLHRAATSAAECLEYALAHDERFGIWGGLSERERRRLKKAAV